MELAQLRAFVAASRERNIARAADSLRLTPSPVSRALARLESELGGELFVRAYHDLELTLLGEQLLPVAVRVLDDVDDISRKSRGEARPIRIASTPWAPAHFIEQLEAQAFGIPAEVAVSSAVSSRLLHLMRHGAIDVAVVHLPVDFVGIESRPLAHYRFSIFADPGNELGRRSSLKLADLAGTKMLSMPDSMQPTAMAAMRSRLAEAGLSDITPLDPQDWFSIPQLLRRSGAVMLGMRSAGMLSNTISTGLVSIPLAEGELDFVVGLAWPQLMIDPRIAHLADALHPHANEPVEVID